MFSRNFGFLTGLGIPEFARFWQIWQIKMVDACDSGDEEVDYADKVITLSLNIFTTVATNST